MTQAILMLGESYANQNLYYKTHFLAGDPFIYLESEGHQMLVVSSMERGRAEKESIVPEVQTFDDYGYRDLRRELSDQTLAFSRMLQRLIKESGVDHLVVEQTFPVVYADGLRAEGIALEVDGDLLAVQRRRKTAGEIEAIQQAQRAGERAARKAIDIIRQSENQRGILHFGGIPLTSERLRAEVEISLLKDEMDTAHEPIIAGGPGAADPHFTGAGPLRAGEAIVMDIFPRSKRSRYWGDLTRTVVKGEPSEQLRRMYSAVQRAQDAALDGIRAGVNGREIHEAADQVFKDAGFAGPEGPRYIHSTGHGVGLEIHESPSLGYTDMELLEGDVVSVEPGLYDPAIGAVRIEDLVVVTRDGYRNLTTLPRQFEV